MAFIVEVLRTNDGSKSCSSSGSRLNFRVFFQGATAPLSGTEKAQYAHACSET